MTGEEQGTVIGVGRIAVRWAISGPLATATKGLSRSLADTPSSQFRRDNSRDGTDSQADSAACEDRPGVRRHAGGNADGLPRTRRRSVHASRNLSRAPAASLRDRLRRPWTEPACRKVPQQSGSGEGSGQDNGAARGPVQACRRRLGCPGSASDMTVGDVAKRTRTRCGAPRMTVAAGREGYGNCRPIAPSVNRFVNRTLRDSVRHRRRSRQSEMGSVLSAEVTTPARDCPRDARDTCRMTHNQRRPGYR
jgi:hypothetical protein